MSDQDGALKHINHYGDMFISAYLQLAHVSLKCGVPIEVLIEDLKNLQQVFITELGDDQGFCERREGTIQ